MNLIEAVLPMEIDNLCTSKLHQNLKEIITGRLMCKWKNLSLLPLGPQIFSVWRFSSCCSTALCKVKAVRFLQQSERPSWTTHV